MNLTGHIFEQKFKMPRAHKDMKHKIAVINFINTERMFLAKALSCTSGYWLTQNRNVYEWKSLFKIDESQIYSFNNRFLIIASSFIERINLDSIFSDFISDGAVFTEVLLLNLKMNEKSVEFNKQAEIAMIENILNVTGKYAAQHYDMVIHVKNTDSKSFDELSVKFYEKYNIAYRLYDGGNIKDILKNIIREIEIPQTQSVESAVYEAEQSVALRN